MNKKLNEEYKQKIKTTIKRYIHDPVMLHVVLDDILTSLLFELGYSEIVEMFESQNKG